MKEPEEKEDDLGFAWRVEGVPQGMPADLLDKITGDEDTLAVSSPEAVVAAGKRHAEILPHHVNAATMCCQRGPCMWLWTMTVRSAAQIRGSSRINISRVRQCNAYAGDATDLADANVYSCSLWWPLPLAWVPISFRATLRPLLTNGWEKMLKLRGYDFSWRWWGPDVFEADSPERRKQTMPTPKAEQGLYFDK